MIERGVPGAARSRPPEGHHCNRFGRLDAPGGANREDLLSARTRWPPVSNRMPSQTTAAIRLVDLRKCLILGIENELKVATEEAPVLGQGQ